MEQRRTSPLVSRSACPVAVDLGQSRGTVPRLGGKVRRAIECHSIVVIEQCHGFERLAALELPKDAREQGAAWLGRPRIESLTHPRIARHTCDAVDGLHIALGSL